MQGKTEDVLVSFGGSAVEFHVRAWQLRHFLKQKQQSSDRRPTGRAAAADGALLEGCHFPNLLYTACTRGLMDSIVQRCIHPTREHCIDIEAA